MTHKADAATKGSAEQLIRLGWWEWVRLPGVTPTTIKAKCDTGAAVSALHAENLEVVTNGELTMVRFSVIPGGEPVELRRIGQVAIKSSNGDAQQRPVVLVPVQIAGVTVAIECTLTDRTPMAYPMLLGRSALAGRFLVDPSAGRLHRKPRAPRGQQ